MGFFLVFHLSCFMNMGTGATKSGIHVYADYSTEKRNNISELNISLNTHFPH